MISSHETEVAVFWTADDPAYLHWVTWTRDTGVLLHRWRARDDRLATEPEHRGRTVLATTTDPAEADRLARSALA